MSISYPTDSLPGITATVRDFNNVTDHTEQKDTGNTTAVSANTAFHKWGDDTGTYNYFTVAVEETTFTLTAHGLSVGDELKLHPTTTLPTTPTGVTYASKFIVYTNHDLAAFFVFF